MTAAPFPPNSRYAGVEVAELTAPDGTVTAYLRRRFVPDPARLATLARHRVATGDRLDLLAERYYGDPIQFWRICDANGALDPADLLVRPGDAVVVPYPREMGGDGDA